MVAASLLLYHHVRRSSLVSVAIVLALLCALCLLGYAALASDLSSGPTPDGPLVGPFRWWAADDVA